MTDPEGSPAWPPVGPRRHLDGTLAYLGVRAWLLVGIVVAALLFVALLAQISGLVVPLVIASVIGALLVPAVDWLHHRGLARGLAASAVLAGLVAVVAGSVWIVVAGIIDQGSEISAQITAGLDLVADQLAQWGIDIGSAAELSAQLGDFLTGSAAGISSALSGLLSNLASFAIGTFVAAFLLFYILVDWHRLTGWVGGHMGVPPTLGEGVVRDAVSSIRQYFGGLTISALVTAVLIGATAALLDVPLAFAIALVTLVTSYVPYLGAIFSGAFATLIALGAQGPTAALIMLAVILVVQNVVQTLVLTRVTSDALSLHPIVNLGSTIVGAGLAGILGATLSAPLVAMTLRVHARLTAGRASDETATEEGVEAGSSAAPDPAAPA